MKSSILLALTLLFGSMQATAQLPPIEPGVSQELARWRAARYSDIRYKLNLTLEKMSPVLKGTIEIRVKVSEPPASAGGQKARELFPLIILDWRKIKGHEEKSTISNLVVNGNAASVLRNGIAPLDEPQYHEPSEHIVIAGGVKAGENVITLDFTSPILTSGSAITRYIDKEDGSEYIYSLFVPSDASTAFPVFDQPDLKARFSLDVSIPDGWKPISNGAPIRGWTLDGSGPVGAGVTFAETKPISTYVFAFAAGPWEKVSTGATAGGNASRSERVSTAPSTQARDTLPTGRVSASGGDGSIYVRKSQAAKFQPHAAEVFRLNREAIKFFEQYFDYKFPFPKYDLVLIPEFPFGGMEHAGATFLRESSIIFPQEPTKNDHISRALLMFHEASHQWFGDTVTMRWFDDLWLKEGFATFTAYRALERIMPEMMAWKVFYERVKQAAYQTDSTKGTTAIYQPIANLSAAKSAYGNIVYNKAPAFLRQSEFYLGEAKFQTAVRAFLKKHEFGNAGWEDLVSEFESARGKKLDSWANAWIKQRGVPTIRLLRDESADEKTYVGFSMTQRNGLDKKLSWLQRVNVFQSFRPESKPVPGNLSDYEITAYDADRNFTEFPLQITRSHATISPNFVFPNYGDYGYGIFLLDDKSREYVLKNIQNEKDPFLRSMMWGALWDSVREGELDPRAFVELSIKNLPVEQDESTVASILGRTATAINYYLSEPPASAGGQSGRSPNWPAAHAAGSDLGVRLENVLIERMKNAPKLGQRITFYRAFLGMASSANARQTLKDILDLKFEIKDLKLKTKDRFDIVTRLLVLGDPDALRLLADLEKTETSDDAKRYAYAARAGIATAENKAKYWNDFVNNKDISESWIEAAFVPWNSIRHSELTLPYLERALRELPNHKRNRKIFFVNGWLGAFIGGQRSEEAFGIINKFLADNPNLDNDLRLKILENADIIERAVRIRAKYGKS